MKPATIFQNQYKMKYFYFFQGKGSMQTYWLVSGKASTKPQLSFYNEL